MIRTGTVARILISCGLAMTTLALAQTKKNQTIVTYPFGFALSQQVSDLPVSELKFPGQEIHEPGPRPLRLKAQTGPWRQEDPVLQKEVRPLVAASQGISFAGIPSPGYVPSDSNMAIGPNYIVEVVNVQFAVYNKNGTTLAGPTDIQTLFNPLGGNCGGTVGDPIVLYDRQADRWVITMIGAASSYAECVAVSQTNNPAGDVYKRQQQLGRRLRVRCGLPNRRCNRRLQPVCVCVQPFPGLSEVWRMAGCLLLHV